MTSSPFSDPPGPTGTWADETSGSWADEPGSPWSRRLRRSTRDRKLAGVAGGIGRALGIDPVLIRVAFAVLTIFGGSGVALYALGWLLLRGERDEVSAAEALLGRGYSSVPAPLTVILGLVVLGSVTSTFTWGLPLLPFAIGAIVVMGIVGRRRRRSCSQHNARMDRRIQEFADRAERWGDDVGRRAEAWGEDIGRRAERWADQFGRKTERWGDDLHRRMGGRHDWHRGRRRPEPQEHQEQDAPTAAGSSPFDRPAFWEDDPRLAHGHRRDRRGADRPVDLSKDRTAPAPTGGDPDPVGSPAHGTVADEPTAPPAWDPLGAAPFAWDLPEPGPAPVPPEQRRGRQRSRALSRATIGVALIVAAVLAVGVADDWWHLNWAVISASALAVVAAGIFISAIRGRRSNLIGTGIFLSLATAFLTITGFSGQGTFGDQTWDPTSATQVQQEYAVSGGRGVVDLTGLDLSSDDTVSTSLTVNAGEASVLLPADAAVDVTCTANVGSMNCLGESIDGMHNERSVSQPGTGKAGTIELTVHVGFGQVEVHRAP